ncbi:MAG: hypothetical protein FJX11_09095 [Alphaproteobacteria bacterium]|nr:hypothetical protein [Alphaproteobacteria bacterium]
MTIEAFSASVLAAGPPADAGPAVQALWWLRKGNWDRAHQCVQQHEGKADCDWVHAHLHRQEGDLDNARYWYRRAHREPASEPLTDEWTAIARALLTQAGKE